MNGPSRDRGNGTKVLVIRLPAHERAELAKGAETIGMTLSGYVRHLLRRHQAPPPQPGPDRAATRAIMRAHLRVMLEAMAITTGLDPDAKRQLIELALQTFDQETR